MIAAESALARRGQVEWLPAMIWLTLAVSSFVFIEPAPYDILVLLLVGVLYPLGLRLPSEIGVALFLLALFTAGNLFAALGSEDAATTVRPLFIRTYMVVSWLLFTSIVSANPHYVLGLMWKGYVFAAYLAVAWGILEYYNFLPAALAGDAFGRAKGPFKDANVFAPFLVPVALHIVSEIRRRRGLVINIIKFLFISVGVLLAFSRGAWLNFVFSFGMYMLFSVLSARKMGDRLRIVLLVIFLSLATGLFVAWAVSNTAAGQAFFDRATLFHSYDVERGGRFDTQTKALQEFGSNPMGVGPGMSPKEFGIEPHNLYLHTAVEGGWLAAISFSLFLIISVSRGLARVRRQWPLQADLHVVLAALLGTLLQSFFIDSTHWRHLWLLLAVLWALTIAADRGRATNREPRYV